jgi:formate-dependent nitrite reductase membrane component NrfD
VRVGEDEAMAVDGDHGSRSGGKVHTASSDLQGAYYGLPVVKAPHWRWFIINYFFLGGLAGGCGAIGALNELFGRDPAVTRAARYISFAAIVPAPVLLTLDLGRPERALNMFRIIKLKSPMSLGSWALLGLGFCSSAGAVTQCVGDVLRKDLPRPFARLLAVITLPLALFISGYTGVLLAATNVPLWARNHLLMGPTFAASSFSSSLAAIALFLGITEGEKSPAGESLQAAERVALTAELVLLLSGILRLGNLARPLTTGRWGRLFWPVTVFGGILVPLRFIGVAPGSHRRAALPSVLALIGSYTFRALMIFAGRESASRPNDYFEYTKASRR